MILHLDADAFFASVEQAADPRLRGRPMAVGGQARGVIASASYEARRYGIVSAMPTARAKKLCPHLIVVPGDFEKYEHFSRMMFSYAYDFTPVVEVGSIDEGYADVRGNRKRTPREIAATIRRAVHETLRITLSEGVGSNKLVSQVASKLHKPNALVEVPAGTEREFLAPLENRWLPGVGPQLAKVLAQAGLARIGQIAEVPPERLSLFAGRNARTLWEMARGIDDRPVIAEPPAAKSYSEQITFERDQTDADVVLAHLRAIADRLFAKVRADQKTVRTVEVRVRYNDFDECRRSESLSEPTGVETEVYPLLARLLKKAWERRVSLRLVAVKLSGVYDGIFQAHLPLLDAGGDPEQRLRVAHTVDVIRARYGRKAILRGHDLYLAALGAEEDRRDGAGTLRVAESVAGLPDAGGRARPTAKKSRPSLPFVNFKSGYTFLDSLLKPEDIVRLAVARGCRAAAITDPNLHGAVEFWQAAKEAGIKPVIGAELIFENGERRVAYVRDKRGYANLCRLLSSAGGCGEGNAAPTERGGVTPIELWREHCEGLILRAPEMLPEVRYATPRDRPMFDVLQSIRTLSLLDARTPEKRYGRFHFPAPTQIEEWLATDAGRAASRDAEEIVEACEFEFELGGLRFPRYAPADGSTARDFLRRLTLEGTQRRYGKKSAAERARVLRQIEEELAIIAEVGYEEYFLLTWDLLQECRARGIEWITRGSAADSLVCYCLGISDVCPVRFELYFRRFLNRDRMALNKLPDIDMDFAHDRRDDVVDLIFEKYGNHAAVVGGFNTFQGRSAFADIAKVMGVSEWQIRRMTEHLPHASARTVEELARTTEDCKDNDYTEDPYATALRLAVRLDGFPRHPKMHPCGVVLSRVPVTELVPVFRSAKGYPTAHFDMDSVEAIGLVKMDILAQGGLAVMRDTKARLRARGIAVDLKALEPWDDAEVWRMIASGNARGVHHIESPAMTSLERMVNVNNIDDLIAIVSVIRPGAANTMRKVNFARRAQRIESVEYAHPCLEPVLRSTYGVVAYEEHVLQICEVFAGIRAGRADILRRALVKNKAENAMRFKDEFVEAARRFGRTEEEIARVWDLLYGFMGYAFCRAHSTAYGVEAYEAAYLKRYYPAEFLACVLTHGKGFYNKLVYSIECRRLGIGFVPPDVNGGNDCEFEVLYETREAEEQKAVIRPPLRQIKGLSDGMLERAARGRPFRSLRDFVVRVRPSKDEMENLMRAGAFDGFGKPRTAQLWEYLELAQSTSAREPGLFDALEEAGRAATPMVGMVPDGVEEPSMLERLKSEMELLGFTVSGHPLDMFPEVRWETYCPIAELGKYPRQRVTVCGLIIEDRLHRQADGRPMKFISICDYSGILECELFASAYKRFGVMTVRHPVVEIEGTVQPFDNGNGHTLQVHAVRKMRQRKGGKRGAN